MLVCCCSRGRAGLDPLYDDGCCFVWRSNGILFPLIRMGVIEVIVAIYQAMIIREGRYRLVHIDQWVNAFQNDRHEGQTLRATVSVDGVKRVGVTNGFSTISRRPWHLQR